MYVFHASTSNVIRIALDTAGLTNATSGLIISTICDNEATPTVYSVASSNIETITTLGTYSAPSTNKCRFKAVDATNHPKIYEIQFANARFAVANAKRMIVTVSGGGITTPTHFLIMLPQGTTISGVQFQSINIHAINGSTGGVENFNKSTQTMQRATVDDSAFTPTSTAFDSNITEATDDHYVGRVVIFTSGNLNRQQAVIEGYSLVGGKGRFTVAQMTEAPANGDSFIVV